MKNKHLLPIFASLLAICFASCNDGIIYSYFWSPSINGNSFDAFDSLESTSLHSDNKSEETSFFSSNISTSQFDGSSYDTSSSSTELTSNNSFSSSSNNFSFDNNISSITTVANGNYLILDGAEYNDGTISLLVRDNDTYCLSGFSRRIIAFELGYSSIQPGNYCLDGIENNGRDNGKCRLQLLKKISEGKVDLITQFGPDYGYANIRISEACDIICRVICYPGWAGDILLKPFLKQISNSDTCSVSYGNSSFSQPIMSFIDDDGSKEFINKWLPIMNKYCIPVSCAVVTDWVGKKQSCLGWDDLNYLKERGTEIVCHTESHLRNKYVKMSVSDLTDSYKRAKNELANHGFDTGVIVYCGDTGDFDNNRAAARNVFDMGVLSGGDANRRESHDLFCIERYNALSKLHQTFNNYYKRIVDKAITNKEWIIWMTHSQYDYFDFKAVREISKMVEYAIFNNVSIVTVSQGFELLTNN